MLRKAIWAVVIVAILAAATLFLLYYYKTYGSLNNLTYRITGAPNPYIAGTPNPADITPPGTTTPQLNAGAQTPVSMVTALSKDSITIHNGNTPARTFAITSATLLFSLAEAGQPARDWSELKVGSKVTVYPAKANNANAGAIAFERDPAFVVTEADAPHSMVGTIAAINGDTVSIASSTGPVSITLTPTTKMVTTVSAGQTGRTMAVGDEVSIGGLSTAEGVTTARFIILAPKQGQ